MSEATEFLGWLIEDTYSVTAEVDSPRDDRLQEFERKGYLKLKGTFANTREYEITSKGATEGLALTTG